MKDDATEKGTVAVRFNYPRKQRYYVLSDSTGYIPADYRPPYGPAAGRQIIVRENE
ncbi:hypothetical protein ACP3TJ_10590 [Desulforudis sp. 1088]|uniref:hypothetical protein n=1 Tax=unclassified Candidatus Desulforudis TaxID=2635950 RepID=UPI00348C0BDE